jgi:hypothetical protein
MNAANPSKLRLELKAELAAVIIPQSKYFTIRSNARDGAP